MRKATRFTVVLAMAAMLVSGAISMAGAAPGGGKGHTAGSGGLTLAPMVTDSNGNGLPNWGDVVTFNVSTTATDRPFVYLACSQNGTNVYAASAGFFSAYLWPWEQDFTLSSDYWTGGAADCTATLYYYDGKRTRNLASLKVPVAA